MMLINVCHMNMAAQGTVRIVSLLLVLFFYYFIVIRLLFPTAVDDVFVIITKDELRFSTAVNDLQWFHSPM